MSVNIPGAIAVVVFYIAILVCGILAGRKTSKSKSKESILVADRGLGLFVSTFTICATMVGGGFLNGSAESVAKNGLLHTQAPIGYALGFLIAGVFFGKKMRAAGYITMFDPFQLKYGKKAGALLFIPHFFGDLFWSASVLAALGATLAIILDINAKLSVIMSAAVAIIYTCFGGLYAVAYTDVIQLGFIFVGLTIAFPFALTNGNVDLDSIKYNWAGEIKSDGIPVYIDTCLLVLGGGIPWQALYQRSLACKTPQTVVWSSIWGSLLSIAMVIPAIMLGFAGKAANWNTTSYDGELPLPDDMYNYILPLSLSYLTPTPVGIVGIGAIAAAVMSSADSCILSTSSIFSKNIYNDILRPNASEREMFWVLRLTIIVVGIMGTLVAVFSHSIYGLFILCGDLMYVILFPQLVIVMYVGFSNAYGSVAGFFVSLILRTISGEPLINFPAAVEFPNYDKANDEQLFPIRSFAMIMGVITVLIVSLLTNFLFKRGIIPAKYDYLGCLENRTIEMRSEEKEVPNDVGMVEFEPTKVSPSDMVVDTKSDMVVDTKSDLSIVNEKQAEAEDNKIIEKF